jgi:hypothetical protein
VCLLWANQRPDPKGRWQALNLFRQRADAESQPIGRAHRAKQRCTGRRLRSQATGPLRSSNE